MYTTRTGDRQDNRIENLELWVVPQPYGQRYNDLIDFDCEDEMNCW